MATTERRTELQRLAEQATPGPWSSAEVHGRFYVGNDGDDPHFIAHLYSHSAQEDAAFIAAANPTAILALLSLAAESEELRADLERAEDEVQGLRQNVGDVGDHNQELEAENNMLRRSNEERDRRILRYMNERDAALESRRSLESRYSALEKALKKVDPETLGGNCGACHGLGQDENANFFCHECGGTGWVGLGALLEASDRGVSDG